MVQMWICFTNLKWWKVHPNRWCHYSGLFYNKCHNEYAIHWVVKGVVTTLGISEFNISYFKHSQLSLSQSDVVSAIDNGITVTTRQSFSSKLYSLYFLSTKNVFQCCPYWKQRVQLSTLHTEVRSYILHISFLRYALTQVRSERPHDSAREEDSRQLLRLHREAGEDPADLDTPSRWVYFVLIRSHLFSFVLICSHDQTLQEKRRRNLLLELRHLEKRGGYWTVCMKNVIVKWVGKPKENATLSLN